jgi:hypothetical protein
MKKAVLAIVLGISGAVGGCSAPKRPPGQVTATDQALRTENGFGQNGLTTNGIWANGIWANGIWANGIWANGIWANGIWANGIWANGIWANGIWANGIWANGLTGDAAIPGNALRTNVYARQLLQYIYSCAMPAGTGGMPGIRDTTLDPNDGTLLCGPAGECDEGYTCSSDGTCVIPLVGAVGVGVNADGETWADTGTCDESCQRWVSACLLARTNAYGVHVQISMRPPPVASAPPGHERQFQEIHDLLAPAPGSVEADTFTFREGAYYGNIFATAPVDPTPPSGGTGSTDGPIINTPSFYACAGPDSNTPEITRRFCSSQGDQSVIKVPGVCWPPASGATEPPVCDGLDATTGTIFGCFTSADPTQPRTHYDEVITVYLRQPLAVCGNEVCEPPGEDATSCPSDCHPSGWAKSLVDVVSGDEAIGTFEFQGSSAISPVDDTVVLVGKNITTSTQVSLGGPLLPAASGDVLVAKYTAAGDYVWGTHFPMPSLRYGVAVGGDGTIWISGWLPFTSGVVNLAKVTSGGTLLSGWPIALGGAALGGPIGELAVDPAGNVLMVGVYHGTATFATTPTPTSLVSPPTRFGSFAVKVGPDGTPAWAADLGAAGDVTSLAVDPSGDLLFAIDVSSATDTAESTALYRLSSSSGAPLVLMASPSWNPQTTKGPVVFRAVVADAAGELYVTGSFSGSHDFGPGCGAATAATGSSEYFVAKYAPDGAECRWVARGTMVCPPGAIFCDDGLFEGGSLAFDRSGNIVVGGRLNALNAAGAAAVAGVGAAVDLGAGPFDTYRFANPFVASYTPDGGFRWAKQIPIVLAGGLGATSVDSHDNVVVSGTYTGSMQLDGHLLVNAVPELITNEASNTFVGSFRAPSPALDTSPPSIGAATDVAGTPLFTVPHDIYTEATGPSGAVVFYMPPTAIDDGDLGATVACSQPPNTMFRIGRTVVTCTATDPLGHPSDPAAGRFTVTVADTLAPQFSHVPAPITVEATGRGGATVTYAAPTAADQVDGARPVTCDPPSGSTIPVGTTIVACTSTDARANAARVTFPVTVVDSAPPVLSLPGDIVATATSAGGAVVTYTASATDAVDGPVTPVCVPASGSTFGLGRTTVACTATDVPGHTASGTFQVWVQFAWSGILPPVNPNGSSIFKLGSTVPVKFALTGPSAGITNAVAKLTLAPVSSSVTGADIQAVSTSAATTGDLFRFDGSQYIFNLATKPRSVGTWRLAIDLGDDVSRTVLISLRR